MLKKIRLATLKDECFLRKIRNENRQYFLKTKFISSKKHHKWLQKRLKKDLIFIIYQKDKLIGTISLLNWNTKNNICELGRFIISKSFRHRGTGHTVLKRFNDICKLFDIKKIRLMVKKNNIDAYNFYLNRGFKPYKIKKHKIYMKRKII